jgi:hypothetical protein
LDEQFQVVALHHAAMKEGGENCGSSIAAVLEFVKSEFSAWKAKRETKPFAMPADTTAAEALRQINVDFGRTDITVLGKGTKRLSGPARIESANYIASAAAAPPRRRVKPAKPAKRVRVKPAAPALPPAEVLFKAAVQLRDGPKTGAPEAAQKFKEAADLGHVAAQGEYARCVHDGCGVMINLPEAFRCAKLAAAGGDALGRAVLARCFRLGEGAAKDPSQAAEHAKKSAESGNLFGLAEWGMCLRNGVGVAGDQAAGAEQARRSAEADCVWGQNAFGVCMQSGIGVAKDEAEAVRFYRLAAAQGDADAQFNLGV